MDYTTTIRNENFLLVQDSLLFVICILVTKLHDLVTDQLPILFNQYLIFRFEKIR